MFKSGMMIAGRYEIIEVVGSGGMSVVYKAKCHKLNRYVAIKVLKQEFSDDKNFVTKFRVEAQSAAGLSHPNIVNVFDVGEDEGIYFIVMELVEGITLKEYIQDSGRLSIEKAIDFSIQIASGIEVAHDNHTIHRDIKPQNIIVSKTGTVKVTDFGIARAATSNTVGANAMGSVHYISPEQARGGYSDERSDIYSLGITMYEMLTGRVPFEGDNNVTIALMHIQEAMIPPREYYPEIPASLEKIVLKCTQKKPERRYLTANALIADLKRVQNNPNVDLVAATSLVSDSPTVVMSDEELTAIKKGVLYEEPVPVNTATKAPMAPPVADAEVLDAINELDTLYGEYEDQEDDEVEDEYVNEKDENILEIDPKLELIIKVGAIVAAIFLVVLGFVLVGSFAGWFKLGDKGKDATTEAESGQVEMIDVVGLTEEAADKSLKDAGFSSTQFEFSYENSDTIEAGYVISQSIDKGTMVTEEDKIKIVVSSGKEEVEIPDVTGYDDEQATTMLTEAGFEVKHAYDYDEEIEKNKIISQEPAGGKKAATGSKVTITVSNGPEVSEVTMVDLTGKTLTDAESALNQLGLALGTTTQEYSDTYESGQVIKQSQAVGATVTTGTKVDITLSKGKDPASTTEATTTEATTEAAEKSYTASFTGSVTVSSAYTMPANGVTVKVIFKQGNVAYTLLDGMVTSFPIDATKFSPVTKLGADSGAVVVTVYDGNTDVTSSFNSTVAPSFKEVSN